MPSGIYQHKPQQGFQKGNKFGDRFKKGCIPWITGKAHTQETKNKISVINKKEKIKLKCLICKKEFEKNESEYKSRKHHFCSLPCYWNYIQGVNAPLWRGGISFKEYPLGWTKTFKEQIRYRDNYKCQICGVPEIECNVRLHIHHIDYDKKNIKKENLISLCKVCHAKTNNNRKYWINYFKQEDKNARIQIEIP